jgi:hypothetical protein
MRSSGRPGGVAITVRTAENDRAAGSAKRCMRSGVDASRLKRRYIAAERQTAAEHPDRARRVKMQDERRPLDPTRKMLKIFGVKVTDYEERATALLEQLSATAPSDAGALLRLTTELVELTANLNAHLRDMNGHVLDTQARVLSELKTVLARGQP